MLEGLVALPRCGVKSLYCSISMTNCVMYSIVKGRAEDGNPDM